MNLPACVRPVLTMLHPVVSRPTYHRLLILGLAARLTTGRRTVTNVLRPVRDQAQGHASSSHRVFSRHRWSTWALARALITFRLDHVVPPGPVRLAGDETVTDHPGRTVFGKGRHRDGVRSTYSDIAYRWGHQWVVMAMLRKLPFATRPWALPVLVALDRPPAWERVHGTRHRTPAHLARRLLARLIRWFPHRHVIVAGDPGYGTSETARFAVNIVATFAWVVNLMAMPPYTSRRHRARATPWDAHA
jgi:DDE superfamily endonuclease